MKNKNIRKNRSILYLSLIHISSSVAVEAAVDVIIGKEKALGVLRETIPEEMHNEVEIVFHG